MNVSLKNGRKPTLCLFIKKDKQLIKNYQPVPLLPACAKIFEKKKKKLTHCLNT